MQSSCQTLSRPTAIISCRTVASLLSCWKIVVSECCLLVLYFLLQYTTSHFAAVWVFTADVVSYAQGLKYALSKNVKLHFPPRTQRLYLFSLTQPIEHIHQGVSKPSLCSFLLRVWKGKNATPEPSLLFTRWSASLTPVSWGGFHPHFFRLV